MDFLKKKLACSTEDKRRWIDPRHPVLSIRQQCSLLGLPGSTYYYQPRPESEENLRLLRGLDGSNNECALSKPALSKHSKQRSKKPSPSLLPETPQPTSNTPATD